MSKISKKMYFWLDYWILLLAISVSLYLLFFVNEPRRLGPLQRLTLEAVGRLSEPMTSVRRWLHLRKTNEELRYQNTLLQIKNSQMAEAYYENIRLRQMLHFQTEEEWPLVPAKVIGASGKKGMVGLKVAVGSKQGIKEHMTVISADGLVGRIVSVSENFSVVQTIADADFRAAAMIQRSRVQGIFQWAGYTYGTLKGVYITADVKVGDVVITSGLNSMFVPGLKIGIVTYVDDASSGMFKKINVKVRTDFSNLEEVFIINKPPIQLMVIP